MTEHTSGVSEKQALNVIHEIQAGHTHGDRYAIGIDVAASMKEWGLSVLRIGQDSFACEIVAVFPHALLTKAGAEHASGWCRPTELVLKTLLQWIANEKIEAAVAVDVPFGWPAKHRAFLNFFDAMNGLQASHELPSRNDFELRLCDQTISERFDNEKVTPLSVSADKLGQAAFRWAVERQELQSLLGCIDIGLPTRPSNAARVHCFETYPAAFVRCCFPLRSAYKSAKQIPVRQALLADLIRTYSVTETRQSTAWCARACTQAGSPDALDSLLCAFCAHDYLQWKSGVAGIIMSTPAKILNRILTSDDESRIALEGWILFRYESTGATGASQ